MKYESMILAGLFGACFALCVLVLGAMLTMTASPVQLAGAHAATTVASAAQAG
ncbi:MULTISPECIES: hypothetical protein [unclassified Rhodanobacter]|uniref:hypothetical protein n=1 Tax=unclassified Rhodanobacter TaxID=2621553 RepID=UPI000A57A5E6|nr:MULTISPECIES: hypothetical protein [unclassified Rhodanobacter]